MEPEVKNYNAVARFFHWISALAVIGMFCLGLWMVELSYYNTWYHKAPSIHKSVGIILCLVTVLRLVWKAVSQSPKVEGSPLIRKLAISAHHFMYLNLFVIFFSGYLISTADGRGIDVFNWFTVPAMGSFIQNQADIAGAVHTIAAWTLIAVVILHAAAALKHHFISKDNTLRKMLGVSK